VSIPFLPESGSYRAIKYRDLRTNSHRGVIATPFGSSLTKTSLLIERENSLPIVLHADHDPAVLAGAATRALSRRRRVKLSEDEMVASVVSLVVQFLYSGLIATGY